MYDSGTKGIEVDIADQLQQVGLLLADQGLVAILKNMSGTMMSPVEINGIAGE